MTDLCVELVLFGAQVFHLLMQIPSTVETAWSSILLEGDWVRLWWLREKVRKDQAPRKDSWSGHRHGREEERDDRSGGRVDVAF